MSVPVLWETSFWGVGQGLFYTGRVNQLGGVERHFDYVFDCGTLTRGNYLDAAVQGYHRKLPNRRLGMLVVSHLDVDHINGIEALLDGGSVDLAVLPYLAPAMRVLLASRTPAAPQWYAEFLADPPGWLRGQGAERVIQVAGGDGPQGSDGVPFTELPPAAEQGADVPARPVARFQGPSRDVLAEIEGGENEVGNLTDTDDVVTSQGYVSAASWYFVFFNRDRDPDLVRSVTTTVRRLLRGRPLKDAFADTALLAELKRQYRRLGRPNDTSLAMWEGTRNEGQVVVLYPRPGCPFDGTCGLWPLRRWPANQSGYVGGALTGDIPANREWGALARRFGLDRHDMKLAHYQVPHHGSKYSWSADQADLPTCVSHVITCGSRNTKHPAAEVLADLWSADANPQVIHEGMRRRLTALVTAA